MNDKEKIRQELQIQNKLISEKSQQIAYNAMAKHLKYFLEIKAVSLIGLYYPCKNEIDILNIIQIAGIDIQLALPCILDDNQMLFRSFNQNTKLTKGKFGIMEPSNTTQEYPELYIVPSIGCDKFFYRLGKGGGYYDRFFANFPNCVKLSLIYDHQLVEKLPHEKHDIRLNAIITPTSIFIS